MSYLNSADSSTYERLYSENTKKAHTNLITQMKDVSQAPTLPLQSALLERMRYKSPPPNLGTPKKPTTTKLYEDAKQRLMRRKQREKDLSLGEAPVLITFMTDEGSLKVSRAMARESIIATPARANSGKLASCSTLV